MPNVSPGVLLSDLCSGLLSPCLRWRGWDTGRGHDRPASYRQHQGQMCWGVLGWRARLGLTVRRWGPGAADSGPLMGQKGRVPGAGLVQKNPLPWRLPGKLSALPSPRPHPLGACGQNCASEPLGTSSVPDLKPGSRTPTTPSSPACSQCLWLGQLTSRGAWRLIPANGRTSSGGGRFEWSLKNLMAPRRQDGLPCPISSRAKRGSATTVASQTFPSQLSAPPQNLSPHRATFQDGQGSAPLAFVVLCGCGVCLANLWMSAPGPVCRPSGVFHLTRVGLFHNWKLLAMLKSLMLSH